MLAMSSPTGHNVNLKRTGLFTFTGIPAREGCRALGIYCPDAWRAGDTFDGYDTKGEESPSMKDKAALATLVIFLGGFAVLWLTRVTSTRHLIDNMVAGYLLAWGLYVFLSDVPRKEIRARFLLMTVVGQLCWDSRILWRGGCDQLPNPARHPGRIWFTGQAMFTILSWGTGMRHIIVNEASLSGETSAKRLCLPAHPPEEFDLRYDQHGFRNDEDMERAEVVVVGDSYVESPMLPKSALLTTVMEKSLGAPVINIGDQRI